MEKMIKFFNHYYELEENMAKDKQKKGVGDSTKFIKRVAVISCFLGFFILLLNVVIYAWLVPLYQNYRSYAMKTHAFLAYELELTNSSKNQLNSQQFAPLKTGYEDFVKINGNVVGYSKSYVSSLQTYEEFLAVRLGLTDDEPTDWAPVFALFDGYTPVKDATLAEEDDTDKIQSFQTSLQNLIAFKQVLDEEAEKLAGMTDDQSVEEELSDFVRELVLGDTISAMLENDETTGMDGFATLNAQIYWLSVTQDTERKLTDEEKEAWNNIIQVKTMVENVRASQTNLIDSVPALLSAYDEFIRLQDVFADEFRQVSSTLSYIRGYSKAQYGVADRTAHEQAVEKVLEDIGAKEYEQTLDGMLENISAFRIADSDEESISEFKTLLNSIAATEEGKLTALEQSIDENNALNADVATIYATCESAYKQVTSYVEELEKFSESADEKAADYYNFQHIWSVIFMVYDILAIVIAFSYFLFLFCTFMNERKQSETNSVDGN